MPSITLVCRTPAAVREDPVQSLLERLGELDQRRDCHCRSLGRYHCSAEVSTESRARNVSSHSGHEDEVCSAAYCVSSHATTRPTRRPAVRVAGQRPSSSVSRSDRGDRGANCAVRNCHGGNEIGVGRISLPHDRGDSAVRKYNAGDEMAREGIYYPTSCASAAACSAPLETPR